MGLFEKPKNLFEMAYDEKKPDKKEMDGPPSSLSIRKAAEGYIVCASWGDDYGPSYGKQEAAVESKEDVMTKVKEFLDLADKN